MKEKNLEIELLLDQRKALILDIKEFNSNMFKVIVVIIPLIAAWITSYFSIVNEVYAPIIRYIILEIIFLLSLVICACLFGANINRDYIAAIDAYLFDTYHISVLFTNGELSAKHTTGIFGAFALTTSLIGCSAACGILFFAIYVIKQDWAFYHEHWYLFLLFITQIILYGIILIINMRRKITQNSPVKQDCLNYLNR